MNACRYKGESKLKDYMGSGMRASRCKGFLELSDQSHGLQSSKEEEIT